MSRWDKIIEEKVSKSHREKVLNRAGRILESRAEQIDFFQSRRSWMLGGAGFALAGVAAVLAWNLDKNSGLTEEDAALASLGEDLLDADEIAELDILENWDDLEEIGDV